ncbi:MAG: DUF692 family protein [Deltaproteobacteria bacterium]|jgi:uncharacterized protein (UPF0276 family)|nr:DUF692 family protein [Deltaproteobacteria bacterium]
MTKPFLAGLPVSHLFDRANPLIHELLDMAEILEVKNPAPPQWLPRELPVAFHWGYGICEDDFREHFPPLGDYLRQNAPTLFSCDLGPSARRHEGILPLSPLLSREEMHERAKDNLRLLRTRYDGPVAFENYNYYPTGLYSQVCEPTFIREFLEEFRAGLVLDLAHAAISAVNMGYDVFDYLAKLPLDKVAEVHLSKPYLPPEPGRLGVDAHEAPEEREWSWLAFSLNLIRVTGAKPLVLIEYYKDLSVLLDSMKRLLKELGGFGDIPEASALVPPPGDWAFHQPPKRP